MFYPLEHFKKLQSCSHTSLGGRPLNQGSVLSQVSHPGQFFINPTRPKEHNISTNSHQRENNEDLPVIDMGPSWSVTPFLTNFFTNISESPLASLRSLDFQIQVCEGGRFEWTDLALMGVVRTIRHTALYVKSTIFPPNLFDRTQ
jgi:hypothetical protein